MDKKSPTSIDAGVPLLPLIATSELFVQAWREGLQGNQINLKNILSEKATWENPFVANTKDLMEGLATFSNFFDEPSLTVFKMTPIGNEGNQIEVEYHLSFWYPMAWKPRIIIPSKAIITVSNDFKSIISVKEKWEISMLEVFMKQLLPRFWDVWHVFCSPSPEYPPIKDIARVGKVTFVELPQTVSMEVRWSGASKYPGPPLLAAPGFSLFGALRTSKPRRDPFHTVMPIEVQSGKFRHSSGEDMKRSSWIYHVPTSLQEQIMDKARAETVFKIKDDDIEDDDEGENPEEKQDYQTQLSNENINVMKCITGGALRAKDIEFDLDMMKDFESWESKEYLYKIQPKRMIAQVDIQGEADPARISAALQQIREAVASDGSRIFQKDVKLKSNIFDSNKSAAENSAPLLGLQLWNSKACFNMKAEPVMAIYEMQYGYRLTRVHVELEMSEK
eukprot:CAMPEP_0119038996 /NCGR_PEP_ID=MMETSP1177-20130426/8232_1 /TAXON_ID=2985 /ORGANISM="Ochromonas sp, Strain CCMP1899" /LENGTH=447 /DNA_ID=CAMNT_0007002287 /DNA_START=264 /DNA_END=1607 /DNA_ORIENTATION=-